MVADTERMQAIVQKIFATRDRELDCGEVYELMDQLVEMERAGQDVSALLPLVQHHLHICPDCREEYEALKTFLAAYDSA